ncbi:hypothetical protein BGZ94_007910 [Podila epigama]|nr:hypothetical protein BGZ94_007910 [Podila epigama]
MPTILFFKNKSEVRRVVGADVGKIQSYIKSYEGGSSFSGTGQTLGGSGNSLNSPGGAAPAPVLKKKVNLDNAPYHVRLWTALGHLSTGIISLCYTCVQTLSLAATSAKTGLIGDKPPKEIKVVEGPGGDCQIQVRLMDGTSIRGDFEPTHTLKEVHDFVQANLDARGDEELKQTLEEAKLTPRAQLIVTA